MARYMVKFCKGKGIKFISHLDLMRAMERAIRRSGVPVSYSRGFNPHMELSFATPLSVGIWSAGEYMDLRLDVRMDEALLKDSINKALPADINIVSVKEIDDTKPALMSMVDASSYEITIVSTGEDMIAEEQMEGFMALHTIEVVKQGKSGQRTVDIKPMINNLRLKNTGLGYVVLSTVISSGSRSNLNPELLVNALKKYVEGADNFEIRDIYKIDTYIEKDGLLMTPMEV